MSDDNKETFLSLYRNLALRVKNIVLSPREEWTSVHAQKKSINEVLTEFSLPLIALVTLATFLNYIFNHQGVNFELALKQAAVIFSALFGGLYLSYLLVKMILPRFGLSGDTNYAFRLVGYGSGLWYIITLITSIIPELVLLHLASFYSFYIIWETVGHEKATSQEQKMTITALIGIMIHLIPYFVKHFLLKLIYF
ncbi:YIP1 family protein [Geofilum rubicundum]|uniref:YIP1 family protein n=1 Tax=Geofilum rubicundum TaxID=472113 RepID=UPI00078566DB|nr:YIP1 family protein [Geofilum rubicundum]